MGTIIGASIFVQPSVITARVPTTGGVVLAWLVSGVLTLFGALVAAELASAYPRSGGVYVFLREAFGRGAGFLWGWAMFWSMHTGIIAAIATVFARYAARLVPMGDAGISLTAVAVILAVSAVNYVGVGPGARLQTGLTVLKVVAVAAIALVLFAVGTGSGSPATSDIAPAAATGRVGVHDALLAVSAGLFAFGGWHMVTYTGEETVDAARTIPRALALGVVVVTVSYVALNAAYLHVLPLEDVVASRGVAADAARKVLGARGADVVTVVVLISTLGAVTGIVLAGPRVYFAMARDGLLFRWAGSVHPRFRTPHLAIVLQAGWAALLAGTTTYEQLFARVIYTEWLFFAAMAVGLVTLRRRAGYAPIFRMPGGVAPPLLFAVASLAVAGNQLLSEPVDSAVGLGAVLLGLPVYLLWARRPRPEPAR